MDLREYVRVLRRSWILIAAAVLVGVLCAAAASVMTKPVYTADTQLFVAIQSSGSVQELQQGNTFTQARVQSYVKTVATPIVLQPVIDDLGLNTNADELSSRIKATNDLNTVLISITVEDSSPVRAAAIAQGTANSLVRAVEILEKPTTEGLSPVSLSVVAPATAPSAPSFPNTRLNLILGLLLGLAAGIVASLLRSNLDNRISSEEDVRAVTDLPVLGGIAYDSAAVKKPLLSQAANRSPRAESFRQIRTNLQFANVSHRAKSLLVTSSLPGEGKSTTAINLAIALAQAGQTTCLVDADLRRPMIDEYLGLERSAGLTTALVGSADVNDLLQRWGDNDLYVLTSGQIPPNPSELLGSDQMQGLLSGLEDAFDAVIVDAPPLLPVADSAVLAQRVGGVVLVVGSQKIKHNELEKSLAALDMVEANVLGVIMNRLPAKGTDTYSYGYYRQEEKTADPGSKARRRTLEHRNNVTWVSTNAEIDNGRSSVPRFFPYRITEK